MDKLKLGGLRMLTTREADQELKLAARLFPGPWERHSISAAENARAVAEKIETGNARAVVEKTETGNARAVAEKTETGNAGAVAEKIETGIDEELGGRCHEMDEV